MIPIINGISEAWYRYMASSALQATLLALFILGILWIGRRWSPALRYAFMMLALCKFVIPPMLSLPTGLLNRIQPLQWAESAPALRDAESVTQSVLDPVGSVQPRGMQALSQASPPMPSLTASGRLLLLHLSGALLILAVAAVQKMRLSRLASRAASAQAPGLAEAYDALCRSMKLLRKPRLLVSGDYPAPITFGAWKPVVMLPQALVAALPLSEIRVILGHELAHNRRRDPWISWLQVIISAIWWFNPVYWLLSRSIRGVREDCCDDMVLASGLASREFYCRTLLRAARATLENKAATQAAFAYLGKSQPLQRRFKRIMSAKSIRAPKLALAGMLLIFALALVLLPGVQPHILAQNKIPDRAQAQRPVPVTLQTTAVPSHSEKAPDKIKAPSTQESASSAYYRKWLEQDVLYIISPEERDAFLALKSDRERESFIEQFWAKRAPSFKAEHYRRIVYANEHFASSAPGWKTDRGRIYIMLGKPDELEAHPEGGKYAGVTKTYSFEKWSYRHIDGVGDNIEIEFVDKSKSGEYKIALSPDEKF